MPLPPLLTLAALAALTNAAPPPPPQQIQAVHAPPRRDLSGGYAPQTVVCPTTQLVRPATGVNAAEASYVKSRKANADTALTAWLEKTGNFSTACRPTVAFTSSGGGYRALLETAGVVQALDGRDSSFGTSGLYQGLTYQAGLSGGAWFLSSLSGNNWPTISSLQTSLWEPAFQAGLLLPANILASAEYPDILVDVAAKDIAGFDPTVIDPWGRLLSYQLLHGEEGGADIRLDTLTSYSNFTSYNVPYPIITALGVDDSAEGQCEPTINATQYEFSPYEYGSWDKGVSAFASTKYMGSALSNGVPVNPAECTQYYDNLGYILGTSSDIFVAACSILPASNSSNSSLASVLEGIVSSRKRPAFQDLFGIYPNPFYAYPRSTTVNADRLLTMADGGLAGQNIPIWPFIQASNPRNIDVLIASDNSADTSDNFPNGTEIRQTYLNAHAAGLTSMPYIPPVSEFVSRGLNKRATFFGCEDEDTLFIIYLPNVNYTYPSNQPTSKVQYSVEETRGMIANGNAIATQNGDREWSACLACGVKARDGKKEAGGAALPKHCEACFDKYCYRR